MDFVVGAAEDRERANLDVPVARDADVAAAERDEDGDRRLVVGDPAVRQVEPSKPPKSALISPPRNSLVEIARSQPKIAVSSSVAAVRLSIVRSGKVRPPAFWTSRIPSATRTSGRSFQTGK